ncbi:hypothetical protein GCM10009641_79210 [Mycobacterium cookii]|uniref:Lipoprotein n=1 Tax=Nocardioides furvisabuli TaxID=375542 RepID=A0ABN2XCP7_9ACTN|nr:hypothetical protein [Nocardioides furvisabuli]
MHTVRARAATTTIVLAVLALPACSSATPEDLAVPTPSGTTDRDSVGQAEEALALTPLEEALAVLPAGVGGVEFRSDKRSADRLGLLGADGTSVVERGAAYADRRGDVPPSDFAAASSLAPFVEQMTTGGAPFSQLDVEWSLLAQQDSSREESTSTEIIRVRDEVDLTAAYADLASAGFEQRSEGAWEAFHLDGMAADHVDTLNAGLIADRFPSQFFPVVRIHAASHLVVLGDVSGLDPTGAEDRTGLATILEPDGLQDLEWVGMKTSDFFYCGAPVARATSNRDTPERITAWAERFGITELGMPRSTVISWEPGQDVIHRSVFVDTAAAESAMTVREQMYSGVALDDSLALGVLMPADGNNSPYDPGWTMVRQSNVIEVRHNEGRPRAALQTYASGGVGFDTCAP